MTAITEEMKIHEEWYKEAKKVTLEKLPGFINHLMNDYRHDYGTICHAMAAGGIATMWAIDKAPQGGITGFQAGCIMWEFIRHWNYSYNKCGLRLVDYDDMLYPQYYDRFQKTISKSVWESLQAEARQHLANNGGAVTAVTAHWKSIVDGEVPFGYTVAEKE